MVATHGTILIYMFQLFTFFALIPHLTIVSHFNFLARCINRSFRSYLWSSILPEFNPNCILKALDYQISPKIQTWLHEPIILKVT